MRLNQDQIDRFYPLLSKSGRVGGLTFFVFGALFAALGVYILLSFSGEDNEQGAIGMFTAALVCFACGSVLMRSQKKKVQLVLNDDLVEVPSAVSSVSGYMFPMGFYVTFELTGDAGSQIGVQRYITIPPVEKGDRLPLLVSAERKRFFPSDQAVPADLGKIKG